jgi:hypothetical protein
MDILIAAIIKSQEVAAYFYIIISNCYEFILEKGGIQVTQMTGPGFLPLPWEGQWGRSRLPRNYRVYGWQKKPLKGLATNF